MAGFFRQYSINIIESFSKFLSSFKKCLIYLLSYYTLRLHINLVLYVSDIHAEQVIREAVLANFEIYDIRVT